MELLDIGGNCMDEIGDGDELFCGGDEEMDEVDVMVEC